MGRTYSDAVTAGTPMKGSHVRILRGYIEDDLDDASVDFDWSWSNWSAGQDPTIQVRAIFFKEMRDAIQALWDSKGRGDLPDWTQEEPRGASTGHQSPTTIRATHVTDLRRWLNQYEDNHPPLTQGINSHSYYPFSDDKPVIYDIDPNDWTGDVKSLSDTRLFIRTVITGRVLGSEPGAKYTTAYIAEDYAKFQYALEQYANQSMKVFAVFPHLFHKPSDDYTSESYRLAFANKLLAFLNYMHSNDVDLEGILIWNEPNDRPGEEETDYLSESEFARLIYWCWKTLDNSSVFHDNMPRIYWGGIFSLNDDRYTDALNYISGVYEYLSESGLMASEVSPFPWDGINIHMNSARSDDDAYALLKGTKDIQVMNGDDGELIIGEWGVTLDDGPDDLTSLYSSIIQFTRPLYQRVLPDIMFYYSHHVVEDSNGKRGIRWSGVEEISGANRFTLNPYLTPVPDDMKALALRNRYTSIV